jgi:hypothetical protein
VDRAQLLFAALRLDCLPEQRRGLGLLGIDAANSQRAR